MSKSHTGGCSCGAVRFEVDRFLYLMACHCDACKKRTGSAFGLSLVVDEGSVTTFDGKTTTFVRLGESGRKVYYEFCPVCGTTIRWKVDIVPGRLIFAGGAFDRIHDLEVIGEMYADFALPWSRLGCDLVQGGAPDDRFRAELGERSRSVHGTG